MIYGGTNSQITATLEWATSGLVGTLGVRLLDSTLTTVKARVTTGITEFPSSGLYAVQIDLSTVSPPLSAGRYFVMWDDGTVAPGHVALEDFIVHVTTTFATALRQLGAVEATHNAENVSVALIVG